jgi:purine-binding chemotaxis protein CheW
MTTGYVTFRLADRVFATPLDEVREIVRLSGLETLPGMVPPLAGVVVLRGAPLPVFDLRGPGAPGDRGDVLVLQRSPDELVGVAVDGAEAVLGSDELADPTPAPASLPAYVVEVRRGAGGPVLLVDLERLLDTVAAGWQAALPAPV